MNNERVRVLVADNLPHYAGQCAQFLERAGYQVFEAHSLEDARRHLNRTHLHIAILDMRLVTNETQDTSGIDLAMSTDASIAKIILTAYPDYETARRALTPQGAGQAPAIAFLGKHEGFETLLERVQVAVQRLGLNPNLRLEWETLDAITVARMILPEAEGEFLAEQATAVLDLISRLFHGYERVRILRLLFKNSVRIALEVRALQPEKGQGSFVIICGQKVSTEEEATRFREYAPGQSTIVPFLRRTAATTHLGALAYEYASHSFEDVRSLSDLYQLGTEASIQTAMRALLNETVAAWHRGHPVVNGSFRNAGPFAGADVVLTFRESVPKLAKQLLKIGIRFDLTPLGWEIGLPRRNIHSPRPEALYARLEHMSQPLVRCIPGDLRPERILVLGGTKALPIDFLNAGPAPWPRAFATIECAIRFDLWRCVDLGELLEVEEGLNSRGLLPVVVGSASAHRKMIRTILTIRQCAADKIRSDPSSYHVEILRQIAGRVERLSEQEALTDEETNQLARLVIAAAILGHSLEVADHQASSTAIGLIVDPSRRSVRVDGTIIELSQQNYELLLYLYRHAGEVCRRDDLVMEVFGQKFDHMDKSQEDRLNTAIHRLRERLEPGKKRSRYIVNVPEGYMLKCDQDS